MAQTATYDDSSNSSHDFVTDMGMDVDTAAAALQALIPKITPRNDVIGIQCSQTTTDFCVTVTATDIPEDDMSRAPVDITVALDISGSMTGRKLELCKQTLALLLRELSSRDRFGLVVFGDEASLAIPTRKLTKENKDAALRKVQSLSTTGCTNMSGGIGLAAQELQAVESPHEVRTIFLLTDGHANRGISDREGIVALTKSCLGATIDRREIAIHCFGYGSDHDSEMLTEIANATEGGSYYFVDKEDDVSSAFGDALGGVLSVVAQNATVNISVPEEASRHGVAIVNVKHEKAKKELNGSYSVPLGDFYAEESRDVLVETTLSNFSGTKVPHVAVNVSYLDTIHKKLVTSDKITGSIDRPNNNTISATNKHVAVQGIRIRARNIIEETKSVASGGNLEQARSKLKIFESEVLKETADLGLTADPLIVQLLDEFNRILAGLVSQNQFQSEGMKYMASRSAQYSKQRCYESNEQTVNMYRSSKKSAMAMKMKKSAK
jgi:secreted protein with Ig-like and vWFA domain